LTGLDTNVLARYLLQDDSLQSPIADRIIEQLTPQEPGWIGIATILELVWVLNRQNRVRRAAMANILMQLLTREEIVVEQAELVQRALLQFQNGKADFADCLIAASAKAAGCSRTVTFDRDAARDAGMELIG
jgi:predicted nucleic-acid-binding protein